MDARKTRRLAWAGIMTLVLLSAIHCRRSGEAGRAARETAAPWTLALAAPIDHLDVVAREPMILEHPDGSLFVGGFGASRVRVNRTDELTLWKSGDGGTTWARVDVGPGAPRAQGSFGNSDMDLAVAPDGTIYFVTLFFDVEKYEGRQISVGVSNDVGATWKWTLLSNTRFDDRPWVKVAPDGAAHVIWNDGAGVCHAVSQDGGLTWTERERVHPQGLSSHLAMGPSGEIAVRITPVSASGNRYDEGVDLIAVSTDRGMTWRKYAAPGVRDWAPPSSDKEVLPRWVEPLAWDAGGSLYSLWTGAGGVWLARSADQGQTWTTWRVSDGPEPAFYPYLVARGQGELAATWFSARQDVVQAHAARINVAEGPAPPQVAESRPFEPDCWQESRSPDDPPLRFAGGEYLAISFLRRGGLAVVSPVQNWRDKRFGFSLWKVEEHRGDLPRTNESLSKPDLAGIVREHIAAVNNDDIEKNLTFFADDAVFEPDAATKLSGKAQVRNLMEWDVANNARLSIKNLRVEGNSVIAELTEKNEGWRLLGIDSPFTATFEFGGRQIRRVKLEFSPESWKIFEEAFDPFAEWAKQAHPEEYRKMNEAGYSAEGARLFISLAKEWREKPDTERASVEQELIKLENESNDAWMRRDVEAYARLLADDYLETGPDGDMATKAEELALVRSTETTITAVITDDFKVRVYGDAAVVTFRLTFKKPVDGKEMTGQERFTDTWIKRDGRWQCVAVHYSKIARK